MRSIIIVILISFSFQAFSQDEKIFFDQKWKKTTEDNAKYYRTHEKINDSLFLVKDFFISGTLQMETQSTDIDKLVKYGLTVFYYDTGDKKREGEYFKNEKRGTWKGWHKDNSKSYEKNYSDKGELDGKCTYWYENGQLDVEYLYKNGEIIQGGDKHYSSGEVRMNYDYNKKGEKIGRWKTFYKGNKKWVIGSYLNDEKNGEWVDYFSDGKIRKEGFYKMGRKEGKWNFYNENGNLMSNKIYKKDIVKKEYFFNNDGDKIDKIEAMRKPSFNSVPGGIRAYVESQLSVSIPNDSAMDGEIIISFKVDKNGGVTNVVCVQNLKPLLDSTFVKIIRDMPDWTYGKFNNLGADYYYDFTIKYALNNTYYFDDIEDLPSILVESDDIYFHDASEGEVYTIVEKMPEYKGGLPGLFKYLQNSMIYPELAKTNGIQGTVFVNFVVQKTGIVSNVKIIRGVNDLLDKEALRVVKKMPRWTPGFQRGIPVRVSYNLPIKFTLR